MRLLPQRRWLRWSLLATLLVLVTGALVAWHLLDAHRLTRTLLAAAQQQTGLAFEYEGEPAWTLRPDITLVLPTLDVRDPDNNATIARISGLEVRVPWDTARGRARHLKHLSAERLELHWDALQAWLAKQPASASPPFLPDLPAGLRIAEAQLIGDGWRVDASPLAITPLVVGTPGALTLAGNLAVGEQRGPVELRGQLQLDPTGNRFSVALRMATVSGNDWLPNFGGNIMLPADGDAWLLVDGVLPQWPALWPPLPPPLQARDVATAINARWQRDGVLALQASRDGARIDSVFNPDALQRWWSDGTPTSWSPPVQGSLQADALVIDGVTMEGVRLELGETSADSDDAHPP